MEIVADFDFILRFIQFCNHKLIDFSSESKAKSQKLQKSKALIEIAQSQCVTTEALTQKETNRRLVLILW